MTLQPGCGRTVNYIIRNEVYTFFNEHKPDVVIWCLTGKENERLLIENGLNNVINCINKNRLIFVSIDAFAEGKGNYSEDSNLIYFYKVNPLAKYADAKIDGEKMIMQRLNNFIIVRTGPIYGLDANGNWSQIEKTLIDKLRNKEITEFAANLFKTFVHVDDLASALCEMVSIDYKGILHVGPRQKESYYTFYKKRAVRLSLDDSLISSYIISQDVVEKQGIPLDTSMNTQKCGDIMATRFRYV